MVKDSKRNFGLDLMRAIAVVLVMMHHWLGVYGGWREFYFTIFGFYGVEIFFVLSGFLIGNILIKSYLKEPSFGIKTIVNFWNRRWMRTVPLYYFILIIYIVLFFVAKTPLNGLWRYFFFLQNIFHYDTNNHDFYGVSWSLSIEEWFYLSFPLILSLMDFVLNRFMSKIKILFTVIMSFLVISLLIRFSYSFDHNNILSWNNQFRKAVVCREDSIAFGVLGAFIYNLNSGILERMRYYFLLAGLVLLFIGFEIFIKNGLNSDSKPLNEIALYSKTFLFTMISAGALLILPYFYYLKIEVSYATRAISFISKISYSLYLVHTLILEPIVKKIPANGNVLQTIFSLCLFLSTSIIVAFITYNFIELTFLKIRDRLFREKYHAV